MNTPSSYYSKKHSVQEFAKQYKQLCEQFKLQITSGINSINIDELNVPAYEEELEIATQTYIDTVYDTLV